MAIADNQELFLKAKHLIIFLLNACNSLNKNEAKRPTFYLSGRINTWCG